MYIKGVASTLTASPKSFCDPRLNFEQSLGEFLFFVPSLLFTYYLRMVDVAFLLSNHFKKARRGVKEVDGDVLYSELGGVRPHSTQ